MSTPIALLSVENTGTHFAADAISDLTGKNVEWATPSRPSCFDTPDIGCLMQHVYPQDFLSHANAIVSLMLRADKVVVPMRHPTDALISNHDRGHEALPYREHVRSFERVSRWVGTPNIHFFQVDVPEHDRRLEALKLAMFLGESFEPRQIEWTPRNVTPAEKRSELRFWRKREGWDKLDDALDGAVQALGDLRGFFALFDYEIPCI